MVKPILKWVGGKKQILEEVLSNFPKKINNYHEVFIGGGSVLIGLLNSKIKIDGKIYAYDLNKDLINLYKNVQKNPIKLFKITNKYKSNYLNCVDLDEKSKYYYKCRELYRNLKEDGSIENSALFIFLNKTCYRGLYRISEKSGFNTPFGNYKNPDIIDKDNLVNLSKLIKDVEFINCDFRNAFDNIEENDFLYLDPPYYPIKDTTFTKYTKNDFKKEDHDDLFLLCIGLIKVNFLLSNHNLPYLRDIFKNCNIKVINCKRAIHSKKPGSKTEEVLIKNKII